MTFTKCGSGTAVGVFQSLNVKLPGARALGPFFSRTEQGMGHTPPHHYQFLYGASELRTVVFSRSCLVSSPLTERIDCSGCGVGPAMISSMLNGPCSEERGIRKYGTSIDAPAR